MLPGSLFQHVCTAEMSSANASLLTTPIPFYIWRLTNHSVIVTVQSYVTEQKPRGAEIPNVIIGLKSVYWFLSNISEAFS